MHDFRALRLPDALVTGVRKLCERLGGDPEAIGDYMAFGDLASVPRNPELSLCLDRVDPWTLVCDHCGDIALSVVGGTVIDPPPAGAVCPFCKSGTLNIVPMLLKRLHWVTGQLIDPEIEEDIRTIPGVLIPLTDAVIRAWVRLEISRHLRDLAAEAGVPLYGILACMNLRRGMFKRVDVAAPEFLGSPDIYDVAHHQIPELLEETRRFLDAREVRNTPRVFLTDGARRDDFTPITIGSYRYLVEGLIGTGAKCDVFRARLDREPTEFVIVKLLAADEDSDLLTREGEMLRHLETLDGVDAEYFRLFTPRYVGEGTATLPDGTRTPALVTRERHRFNWSFVDIRQAYPRGVDPKAAVWMMNRVIEILGWLHGHHLVHGAVLPEHLIVNPDDHRVLLIDWTYAGSIGAHAPAVVDDRLNFYPRPPVRYFDEQRLSPELDVAMACRSILSLLGFEPGIGASKRARIIDADGVDFRPIVQFLYDHAGFVDSRPEHMDAKTFHDAFGRVAASVYGPRRFVPFHMPVP